ncbi:MAG: hypothetical protein DRI97_11615 [Bacteroidetes bacterium]|nr:MAG: hypothetical protein DRQ40_00800 [Gammaproteobacteria bacterium]RLD54381.1 MAG: hypothetical protein DRI97_11615 [Bacteroidota bacterium]
MSDQIFKDFDAAADEEEEIRLATFVYGGETFEDVNLNVHAGKMLLWMRGGQSIEAVPEMLVLFLGEDEFLRLCEIDVDWSRLQNLVKWLASELGGSGN